jgi:SAM-dependent methyltransferase
MKYIRKLYHLLKSFMALLVAPTDFRFARKKLLSSITMSDKEKLLLKKVLLRVHRNDGMYNLLKAQHYLSVGLSAVHCIENALQKSTGNKNVRSILDFPSGYGRVLRFISVRFPDAEITASEIESATLDFCKRMFSAKAVSSDIDFRKLSLPGKFDLIWCGSLVTHLDENSTINLLKFFYDHLTPAGLCVFTTHGRYTLELLQNEMNTYGLTASGRQELISRFHERGYGYADYKNYHGFGVSLVSHDHMVQTARSVGQWNETSFLERGWDNHQDVYGFTLDTK